MSGEDKKEELEIKVTEGGYKYIEVNGLKIRESINPRRLDEDGETYWEYQTRRKLVKDYEKNHRSRTVWYSHAWGTLNAENAAAVRAKIEAYYNKNKKEENGN